jgi:hypothetical protein
LDLARAYPCGPWPAPPAALTRGCDVPSLGRRPG